MAQGIICSPRTGLTARPSLPPFFLACDTQKKREREDGHLCLGYHFPVPVSSFLRQSQWPSIWQSAYRSTRRLTKVHRSRDDRSIIHDREIRSSEHVCTRGSRSYLPSAFCWNRSESRVPADGGPATVEKSMMERPEYRKGRRGHGGRGSGRSMSDQAWRSRVINADRTRELDDDDRTRG